MHPWKVPNDGLAQSIVTNVVGNLAMCRLVSSLNPSTLRVKIILGGLLGINMGKHPFLWN